MRRAKPISRMARFAGFTMIEMVVVIVISGLIAGMLGLFILRPIQGYDAQTRRATLVDQADTALRRMKRDIGRALPNSIRVKAEGAGNGVVLELLRTVDGGRYRENPPGNAIARLDFTTTDTDFDVEGNLVCTTLGGSLPDVPGCGSYNNALLVIYNLGQTGADAYSGLNVVTAGRTLTVTSAGAADGVSDHIRISAPGFRFAFRSPRQRFFIVDTPVSYVCNTATGTLTRYDQYGLTANHSAVDTDAELLAAGARAALVANQVTAPCTITYQAGTSARAGLVTIGLVVQDAASGESVRLLHQVHVDNVP
jgi:MSHA biogenesis protein MshO